MAVIPVCALLHSALRDRITLHFNRAGNVISLTYDTKNSTCPEDTSGLAEQLEKQAAGKLLFKSNLVLNIPVEAPKLPGLKEIQMKKEEEVKAESEDNRGFLAKYWMYLLPVGIMLLLQAVGAAIPAEK